MLPCPLSDLTVHLLIPSSTTTLPSLSTVTVDCESNLCPRFVQAPSGEVVAAEVVAAAGATVKGIHRETPHT